MREHRQQQTAIFPALLTAFVFAVLCLGSPAQAAQSKNVLRATLQNGLQVVIVRNTLAPVVTTVMNYKVGSNEAPEGFPGMAHAQEHMMFRGSPGLSAGQLADIAAGMGGQFDADTTQNMTQYFFTVPVGDLKTALHISAIRMSGVLDTDKLWKNERRAIEQEVAQDLSNPEYVFYTKLLAAMFRGTPYAHDALGTKPSFDKTTGAMLHTFYDRWYAPNNAILVIVGNVDPQTTLAEVKTLFGKIPRKELPARPAFVFHEVRAKTLHLKTDTPYGMSLISFRMPGSSSPDYAAAKVLSFVLNSQRGSLYALVPEGKALFAGFELSSMQKASLGYAITGFPKGGDGDKLVREMRRIIAKDIKDGVPASLVRAAKRHALASVEFQKNAVPGLAMAWSDALANKGWKSPDEGAAAIQKVTVADVNRVARAYLAEKHAVTAVLTPQASGKPIGSKSFGGQESFAPKHTKNVRLPAWAAAALKRLSIPKATIHPVVSTLPNGIRLIVQPESISDTVEVYGHIKNNAGLEAPKGQEGVSEELDQLFSYGSTTLGRIAFQKALDDIGATESAGTDFSLGVLAAHVERGVDLLAQNELHPVFPERAFKITRAQLAATVAGRLQSPDYLAGRAIRKALFPATDPTLRQATPKTVMALKLKDIRAYYKKVFRPDMTTIVVIGKVDPARAKKMIEKYFGAWSAKGPKPPTVLPLVPDNKPSATVVPDKSSVQNSVTLAETLRLNRFSPAYYPLQLGNHVLGGGFYATRLYQDLRENSGLAYYVGSSFEFGKKRAVYMVGYGCDPKNVSKARAIIIHDLKQMQDEPVSAHDLRQAKAMILREIPLSESGTGSIALNLIHLSSMGLPLNEPMLAARRYVKMTAKQVQKAFAAWIRPDGLAEVTKGQTPR